MSFYTFPCDFTKKPTCMFHDKINLEPDIWHPWTDRSEDVPFRSFEKCVGHGEHKLRQELCIQTPPCGQNSIIDLKHPFLGAISVKDMTKDNCTLGVQGRSAMEEIFLTMVYPLRLWSEKYKSLCPFAFQVYHQLNQTYGNARCSVLNGIVRKELCHSNFVALDNIFSQFAPLPQPFFSTYSEYFQDIRRAVLQRSFRKRCDDCVRLEAIDTCLIIVHESKGWCIIRNLSRISCPRITRGAPRIQVDFKN